MVYFWYVVETNFFINLKLHPFNKKIQFYKQYFVPKKFCIRQKQIMNKIYMFFLATIKKSYCSLLNKYFKFKHAGTKQGHCDICMQSIVFVVFLTKLKSNTIYDCYKK